MESNANDGYLAIIVTGLSWQVRKFTNFVDWYGELQGLKHVIKWTRLYDLKYGSEVASWHHKGSFGIDAEKNRQESRKKRD